MIFEQWGLAVWITDSEGTKLPEYQVEEISYSAIQCWIPSTEGSNFEIHFEVLKNPHPKYGLATCPFLDGVGMDGEVISRATLRDGVYSGVHSMTSVGRSSARLYEFGSRLLVDSDECAELDNSLLEHLGTIKMVFEWGRISAISRAQFSPPREIGPVHEKVAKKGHSSSAKLGKTVPTSPVSKQFDLDVNEEINPVTFVFRYAPDDWLRARGVAQPTPTPEPQGEPGAQKRAHSTLDVVDVDELESDDEIQIVKHLIPAPVARNKKQRISVKEDTTKSKKEED